ncbi:hypothetical protein GCM10023311_18180 [Flaviramulus aquimarinus]|uniref:tRNA modification GTPase n=1 Tax=Flaviramulus aquimarinus TaxID=1170456 RepID=A0ABP9F5D6_9FLAO
MKNKLLFLLILIFTFNNYAQIKFEKGYFIDNNGVKIECLIKNIDWYNNPLEFDFKKNEASLINKKTIKAVKEFAVSGIKYRRFLVDIDRSSEKTNQLSIDRNPLFKEETLFLKSLVDGDSNLYYYKDGALTRFFYSIPNTKEVKQLVYKSYLDKYDKIKKNNRFKQQLLMDLNCSLISRKEVENITYKKKELIGLFVKYNNCINPDVVKYEKKKKKGLFNLYIRPGINSSSLSILNSAVSSRNKDYGNTSNFRLGIETEFILSFNKNKWSVLIEPTYQSFKDEDVDYKSIELPVGVRHYFFLNDSSKIFVNGLFLYDLPMDSKIGLLDISSSSNIALGIGYNFNKKYSLELRYHTNRDVLGDFIAWNSEYKTLSFIAGYNLF